MRMPGTTLADWVEVHARRRPRGESVSSHRARLTWREFDRLVRRVAAGLERRGVSRGDRVAVVADNRIEVLVLFGAASRLGAIFTPIHPSFGVRELGEALEMARPEVIVADPDRTTRLRSLEESRPRGSLEVLPEHFDPEAGGLAADPSRAEGVDVAPEEIGVLLFTSGTTRRPKGVPYTWRNILWNHRQFIDGLELSAADRNYCCAPLAHSAGLGTLTGPLLYLGGTTILEEKFEASAVPERLEEFRATCTFMVPAMWRAAFEQGEWSRRAEELRFGLVGGAPVRAALVERARQYGLELVQGYGMTEAGPMVSLLDSSDPERHARSVGRPGMHVACRIVDEDRQPVEPGASGELEVAGPNVADRYWREPDRTRDSFSNGWFRTGDIARWRDGGEIELLGRVDDRLTTGGENVYPVEIEAALLEREDVRGAAVLGLEDSDWGEAVAAVLELVDGTPPPSLDELAATVRGRLADFKAPRRLAFVEELPRTATGKVDREEIRGRIAREAIEIRERADD